MSSHAYFHDKAVLITGASSGIGEELARQLGAAGARLTLTARRGEKLRALAAEIGGPPATRPLALECDVTRDGDLERAVAETVRERGQLDIAIANAGFGVVGGFGRLTLDDYRRQFETNVFGVIRTLKAALPEVTRARGHLVVLGSVAGWVATPKTSPYSMSKFAVRALANAIGPELAVAGVRVTLVSPGFVASDIRRVDNQGVLHEGAPEPIPAWLVMSREKAARQVLHAIARGRREVIITAHGKLFVALERFAPWVLRAAGRRMARRGRGYRPEVESR